MARVYERLEELEFSGPTPEESSQSTPTLPTVKAEPGEPAPSQASGSQPSQDSQPQSQDSDSQPLSQSQSKGKGKGKGKGKKRHSSDQEGHPAPPKRKGLMDRMLGPLLDLTEPTLNTKKEVEEYLAIPVRSTDPLLWWRLHVEQFPTIARMAREYLSIPPTEVSNNFKI